MIYNRVRFEYWPDGSMKIFAFDWNNTGYIKRRRVSPPFWISQPFSQRIAFRKNHKKGGRLSRWPMRGPFILNKAQPPSIPLYGQNIDTTLTMRRRMRKTGYPITNFTDHGVSFLNWFPYDIERRLDREKAERERETRMT